MIYDTFYRYYVEKATQKRGLLIMTSLETLN